MERLQQIVKAKPNAIILREKDLPAAEYKSLAEQVMALCRSENVPCILHSFIEPALELQAEAIHLPLPLLRRLTEEQKRQFYRIGTSCHSVAEALEAERLGCSYIMAGHIFETDCKKGLAGRGVSFLQQVCETVTIPVYAIGGISAENMASIHQSGAAGACVMSSIMLCKDVEVLLKNLKTF